MTKRTQSDKVLKVKAFEIASNPKYDGYQGGLASMVYKSFDKVSEGNGAATLANKSVITSMPNQQLANELHKPIIRRKEEQFILRLKTIFGVKNI